MVTQVEPPTLYPEIGDDAKLPEKGKHGYYRRVDGWICVSSTHPINRLNFETKGMVYLGDYGDFKLGTRHGKPQEKDRRGASWNPADEQFRLIFQHEGAKEFAAEQIIAFNWHLTPPYREISFPQLKGLEIFDLQCPECSDVVFSSLVEQQAIFNLRAHLTSRMRETHSYSVTDLTELGKEWKLDFHTARSRKPYQPESSAPPPTPDQPQAELDEAFACEFGCGWAPQMGIKDSGKRGARNFHHHRCADNPKNQKESA